MIQRGRTGSGGNRSGLACVAAHVAHPRVPVPVVLLFAAALDGDEGAREELWVRFPWEPLAMDAFSLLVGLEVEALERGGRLPPVEDTEVARILKGVRNPSPVIDRSPDDRTDRS